MPDTQIKPTGIEAAPADYVIPSSAELLLKGAYAHFDGSGAAGSFLPLLRIISDGGTVVLEAVADTEVAAGASADASWFPRVGASAQTAASGATVSGYVIRTSTETFGPAAGHPAKFNVGSLITNDASTFTQPNNQTIRLAHGGFLRCDVAMTFGTNGPAVDPGYFEVDIQILDSLSNPVDELTGPPLYFDHLVGTAVADTYILSGTDTWNADDSAFTPPYDVTMAFNVSVNLTFTGYSMLVSIENPAGLV